MRSAADLAVVNARVRTLDPQVPFAEALAVRGNTIIAVGDNDEIRDFCDGRTVVRDARASTVTPGLMDGHQHLFDGAAIGRGVDFDRIGNLESLQRRLAKERRRVGRGEWILGFGLEYSTFGGRAYHSKLLGSASEGGPVLIYALDLHTAFVNKEALALAGIDGPRDFPDASSIVCDDLGSPTGELRENSAMALVAGVIHRANPETLRKWYLETMFAQNSVGLTGVHLMDGTLGTAALLAELEAAGELTERVWVHYRMNPSSSDEEVREIIARGRRAGSLWDASGIKFILDGVIETGTAWLEEPDAKGEGTEPMWPDLERYRGLARDLSAAGFRLATHAIGDHAVRFVLDTYAGLKPGNHRIEHIETAPPHLIRRFRPEGVTASMQPIHLRWLQPDLSDPWSERLGAERCGHAMPSGDLSELGARVVLGSDWPVAPYDPRLGLFAARLRRAPDLPDSGAIGRSRPMSGEEALGGYTLNAAEVVGRARDLGMLRPGYLADFVVFRDDPMACDPGDLPSDDILLTVVNGRTVYETG